MSADNDLLLDNAAVCSQHPALEDSTVRECITLNVISPLRRELAILREQLAERDAEIAALKALADAMADELREPMALHSYRAAYPKED